MGLLNTFILSIKTGQTITGQFYVLGPNARVINQTCCHQNNLVVDFSSSDPDFCRSYMHHFLRLKSDSPRGWNDNVSHRPLPVASFSTELSAQAIHMTEEKDRCFPFLPEAIVPATMFYVYSTEQHWECELSVVSSSHFCNVKMNIVSCPEQRVVQG